MCFILLIALVLAGSLVFGFGAQYFGIIFMVVLTLLGVQQPAFEQPSPVATLVEASPTYTPDISDVTSNLLGAGTAVPTVPGATFTPDAARNLVPAGTPTPTFGPTRPPGGFGPTPTVTPTFPGGTFTPSPQAPVDNFMLRDDVFLTSNFANDAGCNWQGIAGQVFDANGQPLIGVRVIAMGGGAMLEAESGTATTYGASGWEIKIGDTPAAANYLVAIYDETRGEFAHGISVEFPGTCDANLALLNFVRIF